VKALFDEELLLGVARDDPLANADRIDPKQLSGRDFLLLEDGHKLTEQARAIAREAGANLLDDYQGTSLDGLRQMVGMGMGISVFPCFYERSEIQNDQGVVARPLKMAGVQRPIGLIWRDNSPRSDDFETLGQIIFDTASAMLASD